MSSTAYSICIPRVERNMGNTDVLEVIGSLNLGYIEHLEMKPKIDENDNQYWCFYLHFSNWNYRNPDAMNLREKLNANQQVKVAYDNALYWIIKKSDHTNPKLWDIDRHCDTPWWADSAEEERDTFY